MFASMHYSTVAIQTGAAFMQIAAPMTADQVAWNVPPEVAITAPIWSDQSYLFKFATIANVQIELDEKQSRTLHDALIASFDEFIAPVAAS